MKKENLEYEVVIDFAKGAGDPSRVFRAMADVVEALQLLDKSLIGAIDSGLSAVVVLDDVSSGSIKAFLRSVISDVPDEALSKADWKLILGHFLLKAKYAFLKWCEEKKDVQITREDVEDIQRIIAEEAKNTNVKSLPAYAEVGADKLLSSMRAIRQSLNFLDVKDGVKYVSPYGEVKLSAGADFSEESIRSILTRVVKKVNHITIIKVKKPDYLGRSQWSFQYSGHKIDASIHDQEWLARFQQRLIDVRPGDSLKVDLMHEIFYGYFDEIVHEQYAVDYVIDVVRPESWNQSDAFNDE